MIEYKHVSKVYGDGTEAVSDVSLTINKGELVVFMGQVWQWKNNQYADD